MKRFTFLVVVLFFCLSLFSQDIIVRTNGQKIICKITKVDSVSIHFNYKNNLIKTSTTLPLSEVKDYKYNTSKYIASNDSSFALTAGDELIIYTNHYYNGLTISISGFFTTMIGGYAANQNIIITGVLLGIIGTIIQLESHSHIRNAGILLNQSSTSQNKNISLSPSSSGVGLALNF